MSTRGSRSDLTWRSDWGNRVLAAVRAAGYSGLSEFAQAYPTLTYPALANRLGDDIAPVHVEQLLRDSHLSKGEVTLFARDSIVRIIHEYLPQGWARDERSMVLAAQAFGARSAGLGEEFDEQADTIWDRFDHLEMPGGWLPEGPDDPVLNEAFEGVTFSA